MERLAFVPLVFVAAFLFPPAARGRVEGRVVNGTTGRSVAQEKVLLLSPRPQQGMTLVGETLTDAEGRFSFPQAPGESGVFFLLQVNVRGIPYHAPVEFDSTGRAQVEVKVYDSMRDASALRVGLLRILARASGERIQIQQDYQVENSSRPPETYNDLTGTFRFRLPPDITKPNVTVMGLLNMPIPQTPTPGKEPGEFILHYPIHPGETEVSIGYETDYAPEAFILSSQVPYPVERAELYVTPASLNVASRVFEARGVDSSNDVQQLGAERLARNTVLEARLRGDALLSPQRDVAQGEGQVMVVPNSMTRLAVPILACFMLVLLWALGLRVSKEWPRMKTRGVQGTARKQFEATAEALFNSIADLDELFASGKIEKKLYWKERLELKAKLTAILKKAPPSLVEPYATRRASR
jgi:hypothetical protein